MTQQFSNTFKTQIHSDPQVITLFIIMFLNQPPYEVKNQLIFYKMKRLKLSSSDAVSFVIFKEFSQPCKYSSTFSTNLGSKVKKIMKQQLKLRIPCILFEMICLVLFRNGYFHNVVLTFTNVVHINVEKDNVVSTLSNVAHINVEIRNIGSTLFDVVNSNLEIQNVVSTSI